jgi:chitin synthase
MIYAFCNLHDVSWGTKGDNKIAEPVNPVFVKKENGVETATVDFPVNQSDIDQNYDIFSTTMKPKDIHEPPTERVKMPHTNQEDYFKTFRTQVLLLWIISNSSLVAILTTPELASKIGIDLGNYRSFNPYLTLILWTTALLAYFRFFGSLLYIITQRNRLIEPDRATV